MHACIGNYLDLLPKSVLQSCTPCGLKVAVPSAVEGGCGLRFTFIRRDGYRSSNEDKCQTVWTGGILDMEMHECSHKHAHNARRIRLVKTLLGMAARERIS